MLMVISTLGPPIIKYSNIIPKFKWMKGFNAYYVPGWDTHGMPIEHKVSQELKVTLNDIDPVALRKNVRNMLRSILIFKEKNLRG